MSGLARPARLSRRGDLLLRVLGEHLFSSRTGTGGL